ncbi:MAG: hypothetical protein U5K51_02370 [Flavobacteriaceae bacterium]|nr:hypothetical protein [Flavobacteriaceae bacterium]
MRSLVLLFLLFPLQRLSSQEQVLKFEAAFALNADHFIGTDALKHIYFVRNEVLYKKSEQNTWSYNNVNLGKLTLVDIQNPFKIILFYRDYNTVIVLDNNLNELTDAVSLPGANYTLAGFASENNLWLYSKDDNLLKLFNYQNKNIQLLTQPLSFYQKDFLAEEIFSDNQTVWLGGSRGILTFNQYASFLSFQAISDAHDFTPLKDGTLYQKSDDLIFQNKEDTKKLSLHKKVKIRDYSLNRKELLLFDGDSIYRYQWTDKR